MPATLDTPAQLRPLIVVVRETIASRAKNKQIHNSTAIRWVTRGCATPRGRIRLAAQRGPGCWLTTPAAVREFLAALAAARMPGGAAAPAPESPAARRRRLRQVDAALDRAGL